MYISKLHLQGFKSFLNKTDMDFGEGITAVVGPNGCGKSNIVDAIRWILGEQKISVLRSTKKEDVIFNGSKNRKPLSVCEASLLIHNNREILPIEYNDVEITRRLYRSGESEFYINKTPCRLKDIHNLFVDTGMSSNAYSVIELKMVDSILSHIADDRRHMFEEAAGINHYKQQRQASMRKMAATRSDMERVNDIILEVKNTVNNLSRQMKRYGQHSKLTDELKELEIQTAQGEIQLILEKQVPIENKLSEIKGQHSSISGQMNLDEILIDEVGKLFQETKEQFNTFQNKQSKLESRITDLNSKCLVWSEKISGNDNQKLHFIDELDHCNENMSITKKKIEQLDNLKENLGPEVVSRKKEFKKTDYNYFQISKKYEKLQTEQQEFKNQSEAKFLIIREEEATMERLISSISEKESHREKMEEKAYKYLQKENNSQAEMNILRTEVEKYEKVYNQHIVELDKQKKEHAETEDNILNVKSSLAGYYASKNTMEAKIQFYENIIVSHIGKPAGEKGILQDQKIHPCILGVLSDLLHVEAPYKIAVESVLGEYSHYIIVDTRGNAQKLMQSTDQRISMIALDCVGTTTTNYRKYPAKTLLSVIKYNKKLDPLLHILMGDVCILQKDQNLPPSDQFDWISKKGRYFKRGYIFKSYGKGSPSIIGRQQNLEELSNEMKSLDKEIIKKEKKLEKVINTADSVRKTLLGKTNELDLSIKKLNESENKLNKRDYMLIQQQESMREIKEEIKGTETQIIDMHIRCKSARKNVDKLRDEFDKSNRSQDEFMGKLDTVRTKRNSIQQAVQDTRIKLMEIEKEKEGLDDRLDTFTTHEKDLGVRILKYKADMRQLDKVNKKHSTSISEGKNKLIELNKSLESTSSKKNKMESEYNKTYVELQSLQSSIRERQKRKDEYLDTIRGHELRLSEGENDIKQHRQRILDFYNENLPETTLNLDDFDLSLYKLQVDKIKRSLESIGPVNMAVADEYEQESTRYDFLTQQFGDLEASEKILKETIDKLDVEARARFTETFDAIKENFTQTFASFFDGGEGHLSLAGEDDPLEADIEIIARPPGKKTQALRMLSAGEKALTAIALLFAIYLVKPSPFCILDEVDAPLDDSNINKFTKALREFSGKTQFIVVTHNKLTMEKSDYLYGITQQEQGVSKIVSVKLKAEKMSEAVSRN